MTSTLPSREQLELQSAGSILYLIVSYRNRPEHLREFVKHMPLYLRAHNINCEIIVVEQTDNGLFNKGMLFNVGVKYICQKHTSSENVYICLHDVDILPTKSTNYYRPFPAEINHLYGHTFCLGGVFLVNLSDYKLVNGFPNTYCGWGYEDNEYKRRSERSGIKINRDFFFDRYDRSCFKEMDEDKQALTRKMNLPQTNRNKQHYYKNLDPTLDGLAQITSWRGCLEITNMLDYMLVKADLQMLAEQNSIAVD